MIRGTFFNICLLILVIAIATLLFRCSTQLQKKLQVQSGLDGSSFVVLGENGTPIARLLTTELQCPFIRFDTHEVRMDVRAAPANLQQRPTQSAPVDSKPSTFPILTCEKRIPPHTNSAMIGTLSLPLPKADIKRIVVIGDTGCRLKKSDAVYQACNDSNLYPFAKVAATAARWRPDLVIHVGDFHYRENVCAAGHPGCTKSPWGYGWDAWRADFFNPGAALLKAAPWIMVRGNHESCARAGQGWWRFLDAQPLLTKRDCNDAANDAKGDYSEPYAVPLGGDAQIIVLDTSNTSSGIIPAEDIRQFQFHDTYDKIAMLSHQAKYNIVANHHPILGFFAKQNKDGPVALFPGNQGLQSVFGTINPLLIPPRVDVLLSGHIHTWQQVSFSSPHPTQFIAGFSGTMEDIVPLPVKLPRGATPALGAVVEQHSSWVNDFGFMTMERKGPIKWEVKVWDAAGREHNSCDIEGSHSICKFIQVK